MKPPIVEAFETKIKNEAIADYVKADKRPFPIDEVIVLVLCVAAIIMVGVYAIPVVLINLAYLSYIRTLSHKEKMQIKEEPKVEDVEA